MSIIAKSSTKKFYTRENDEAIIAGLAEGTSVEKIAEAVGHSAPSVQYRIARVLRNDKYDSLDDIKYPGDKAPTTEEA